MMFVYEHMYQLLCSAASGGSESWKMMSFFCEYPRHPRHLNKFISSWISFIYIWLLLGPSRGLLILGVYGKLGVYVLCRLQKYLSATNAHTKQHHRGAKRPCGSRRLRCCCFVCAFVAGNMISALDRAHIHQACHIHQELTVPWKGPKATWFI